MNSKDDPPAGNEPPGLDELARRFTDLWQDQMAAQWRDPELMDSWGRLMQTAGQAMAPLFAMMANPPAPPPANAEAKPAHAPGFPPAGWPFGPWPGPAPAGTAPAGSASEPGVASVDELRGRVAGLETRLAELEASAKPEPEPKPDPSRPSPKRPSRKRGTGSAGA